MTDQESKRRAACRAEEAALVAKVATGDELALRDLHARFGGLLVALAQRVLGSREDAEDVVQEVFLQVWRQATRYDKARSSVSTWLVMITRSRAIDRLRSRGVGERVTDTMVEQGMIPTHTSAKGDSAVLELERQESLRRVLAELPREQREVLDLAYFGGLTQREISEKTGTALGTVKTRTLLAMRKLKSALRDEIGELL
jgi:RNA polymerase sigma-70 factor (ECF subfamily)